MSKRITAKEARREYIEDYVIFENEVRRVARKYIDKYRTYSKSLRRIIHDLSMANTGDISQLPIFDMKAQRLVRNWLAHQHSNSIISIKGQKALGKIRELNIQLFSL